MAKITELEQVMETRITWPDSKPRAARRVGSPFKTEVAKAMREIEEEMARWGIRQFIISRNNQRIFAGDPGAALWWMTQPKRTDQKPELRVLACDKFDQLASNLHAIYLTLDAMRALERWGAYTAEQASQGARLALPPAAAIDGVPWWEILGVKPDWPLDAIEAVWRTKAEKAHPDRGGSTELMMRLNAAMTQAREAQKARSNT